MILIETGNKKAYLQALLPEKEKEVRNKPTYKHSYRTR